MTEDELRAIEADLAGAWCSTEPKYRYNETTRSCYVAVHEDWLGTLEHVWELARQLAELLPPVHAETGLTRWEGWEPTNEQMRLLDVMRECVLGQLRLPEE